MDLLAVGGRPGLGAEKSEAALHQAVVGLAEAHVVGSEQVDARHLDGADDRVELVAFNFDTAAEGGLELVCVGDGCGAPADGVEEGFEVGGLVEAFGLGQFHLLEGPRARLDFSDDLQLFTEARASSSMEVRLTRCCGRSPICPPFTPVRTSRTT